MAGVSGNFTFLFCDLDRVQKSGLQKNGGLEIQKQTQKVSATGELRLLDRIRNKCRLLHYSIRTESAYVDWVTRFLRFNRLPDGTWRHPTDLTVPEIGRFLTHLAVDGKVSASTQTQALCAIVFMYRQVLEIDPGNLASVRAQRPQRLPTVLSVSEVRLILDRGYCRNTTSQAQICCTWKVQLVRADESYFHS